MKMYRVVRVNKVSNISGSIGIRRKLICRRNTKEEAVFIASELMRQLGGKCEVQEREVPQHLLAPHLRG